MIFEKHSLVFEIHGNSPSHCNNINKYAIHFATLPNEMVYRDFSIGVEHLNMHSV